MADDDEKIAFLSRAALVDRLYKAILPDKRANEFSRVRAVSKFLADAHRRLHRAARHLRRHGAASSSSSTSPSRLRST